MPGRLPDLSTGHPLVQVEGGEDVLKVGLEGLASLKMSPWMAFALDTTTLTTLWGNHRADQLFGVLEGVRWASFVSELTGHLKHHMDITLRQSRCGSLPSHIPDQLLLLMDSGAGGQRLIHS